jgi:hypothetical protein
MSLAFYALLQLDLKPTLERLPFMVDAPGTYLGLLAWNLATTSTIPSFFS